MARLVTLLAMAYALGNPALADACTCVPAGRPCDAYWTVDAIFVGRVESIGGASGSVLRGSRVVRFQVLEAFRGVSGSIVEVRTGRGGGDCGSRFKEGAEYFVYAYRQDGSTALGTDICTRTRPIEDAAADLTYGRAVADARASPGRISGQVTLEHRRLDRGVVARPEPLPGVPVLLEGEGDTVRAVTDGYGAFEFANTGPGTYTAKLELPDRYYSLDPQRVRLVDSRACADVSLRVYDNGRVRGRVVDSQGQPIAGLTLELTAAANLDRAGGTAYLRTLTGTDGRYEFSRVPPGRFVIGVNTHSNPKAQIADPRVLHPGVERLRAATVLELDPGTTQTLSDFVMPSSLPYVRLSGVVLDADGYFAAGARVYLAGRHEGDALLTEPVITDGSGRFVIAAVAGREYRLLAERTLTPDAGSRLDSTDPLPITAAPDLPPVRLKLRARH